MADDKIDVAISLCKQDVDFARQLVAQLNPSLNVFFYEDKQEEIVSKSGVEVFAKVFKERAKVVVILSRDEWSASLYTEIEKNAIMDRINEGYDFLIVIPVEPKQTPSWYPTNRIYADPRRFSFAELASLIEFKVVELGGVLKQITVEDKYDLFLKKIEQKKELVKLQETQVAIAEAEKQYVEFKKIFNDKSEYLRKSLIQKIKYEGFNEPTFSASLAIGDFLLECNLLTFGINRAYPILTTQDFGVTFELSEIFGNGESLKQIQKGEFRFYYSNTQIGWAIRYIHSQVRRHEMQILFRDGNMEQHYDLKNPKSSADLLDSWFQLLLECANSSMNKYL